LLVLTLATALSGCASHNSRTIPPGTSEPDKFLFDKGTALLNDRKWLTAREFFKQIVETYTQSPYRPDAKLGVADTYLGENSAESLVLAINEYREFLSFYPTNKRADYAQFKLAMAHFRQMRAPQRDQSETREAIKEFEAFIDRYPNSELMPEAKAKLREAKDRLDAADYAVGLFYFRSRWYPGAVDRFKALLKADPQYSARDAVFYYYAESLVKLQRPAEALPLFEQLVQEFERSEYLEEARKRIDELKAQTAAKPPA
jgi:outer membrane protein assembly factor BamD